MRDLERRLAKFVSQAASGVHLLITRHRRVVAQLGPAGADGVHVGVRCGRGRLVPLLSNATKGRSGADLADDRRGGADR